MNDNPHIGESFESFLRDEGVGRAAVGGCLLSPHPVAILGRLRDDDGGDLGRWNPA